MGHFVRGIAVIDTSVLLNFLAVDRAILLHQHPHLRFLVTDHVRGEITDRRPERQERFDLALEAKYFDSVVVSDPRELAVFAEILSEGRLDIGESAAAAVALVRGVMLATDDGRAKKILSRRYPKLQITDTIHVIRELVAANVLKVDEANRLKEDLEVNHRFKMPFPKFE